MRSQLSPVTPGALGLAQLAVVGKVNAGQDHVVPSLLLPSLGAPATLMLQGLRWLWGHFPLPQPGQ